MSKEIVENYIFNGFGFPIIIPLAVFKTNSRGIKYLDIDMEELKDKVAYRLIKYQYAYTGANLKFIRNYLDCSTIQMATILDVAQQTISNWEKKVDAPLPLNENQRSKLIFKLQQYHFNKKEEEINEAILKSKISSNEVHTGPLEMDELNHAG